jgi:hypothetical protein
MPTKQSHYFVEIASPPEFTLNEAEGAARNDTKNY